MVQGLTRLAGIPFLLFLCYKVCVALIPVILFTLGILILIGIYCSLLHAYYFLLPTRVTDWISNNLNKLIRPNRYGSSARWSTILVMPPIILVTPFLTLEYGLFIWRVSKVVVESLGGSF